MTVQAITPSDAAADPAHPDHDRWVKERTLAMEVEHAKRVGLPLRVAEAENLRLLELADKKGPPAKLTKKQPKKNKGHAARVDGRGVMKRAPRQLVQGARVSPCGRCGTCLGCRRERRIQAMSHAALQGELKWVAVIWKLGIYAQMASSCTGPFSGMTKRDANRILIRRLEDVCDASVPQMGPWR